MSNNIKGDFISGVIWGVIEKFAILFVGFFITMLLARKLTAADYGLVSMIYIFTVLANVVIDGGFGHALIQKDTLNKVGNSTVFYFNVVMGFFVYMLLYASAPLIADFYRQPDLVSISRVSFLCLPLNALCLIQHTLLTKHMKVKELTIVSLTSVIASGAMGIYFAFSGYGVWALVYQSLTLYVVKCILLWSIVKWRPILAFNFNYIKEIWGFSINMLGVCTMAAIFQNIYTILIGRFYHVDQVGYYNQAFRMQSVVSTAITSSIQRVSFPAFAEMQDSVERLRNAYKKVICITMFIHLPMMMGAIMVSHDMFLLLLSERWLPSVPIFCILCIAESLYPLHMINVNVLKALGQGHGYFKLELFKRALMVLFIIVTIRYSIPILLIGYAMATLISVVVNMKFCGRAISYGIGQQIRDLSPIFLFTGIMCFCIYFVNQLNVPIVARLIIDILVGVISYSFAAYVSKYDVLTDLICSVKNKFNSND